MIGSSFIGLANNAALLIALGLLFDTVVLRPSFEKTTVKILTGIVFGLLGMAVMVTPWEFMPGLVFDTRSVIISIGGLFFGALPTLVTMVMTGAFRLFQGGIGAWTGVGVIVTSGVLGVLWRHKRKRVLDNISLSELYLFGIVVHIAMLLWMLSLPSEISKNVLSDISLPVLLIYPPGTVLLGKLMISRLKRKKESDTLLRSEARWRSLTETSPDNVVTLDSDLNIEYANFAPPGLTVEKMIGTPFFLNIEDPEKKKEISKILQGVLSTGDQNAYEIEHKTPSGTVIHYESQVVPRRLAGSSNIIGLTVCSRDITKRRQAEERLAESEQRYSILFNNASQSISVAQDGSLVFINPMTEKLLGRPEADIVNKPFTAFLHPDDRELVLSRHILRMKGEELPSSYLFRIVRPSNEIRWVELSSVPIEWNQKPATLNYLHDTTERKLAEDRIKENLKEKEVLLHEIHHRVKNNMQVIISLLKLQSIGVDDDQVKKIMAESQNRVYAMAAVHETLHGAENISEIDLKAYLLKIATAVFSSYATDQDKVSLNCNIDDSTISIDQAYQLGLVINELISNSLKYAFPEGGAGEIAIRVNRSDEALYLNIGDDGVGIPESVNWRTPESLGLKLVRTLIENQLNGSIELLKENGTRFKISIPIKSKSPVKS